MKFFPPLTIGAALLMSFGVGCHHRSRAQPATEPAASRKQSVNPDAGENVRAASRARALGSNDNGEDYYLALMTPDEVEILRARGRASGRTNFQLTDFLSSQERANLRRRDLDHRP